MTSSVIEKLVELRGIESNYVDAWGKPAKVSEESKIKLLRVMGYQVDDENTLKDQLQEQINESWMLPLNPVQVNRVGDTLLTAIRLPIELVNDSFILDIETEQGERMQQNFVPSDGELINVTHIDDVEFQEYIVDINGDLPLGYHTVTLRSDDGDHLADMRLVVAPKSCYKQEDIAAGKKVWGLSVQLYCLRSENNWGVGDFSDLSYLLQQAGRQGAQFVGLNPIHALYPASPDNCSPYSPSSRRWINFIYLDVTKIEGYEQESVQTIVNSAEFKASLNHVRNIEYVDYDAVTRMKLQVLNAIFDYQYEAFLSKNNEVSKEFKAFVEQGGESLDMLATYDAIQEDLATQGKACWGWPVFPKDVNEYHNKGVAKFKKANLKRVTFYMFLQWQAAKQLEQANQTALDSGMKIGIYRDLAVGVSEGSAEIWGNRDLYVVDASVGAPPDVLGPLGQDWGLPPMDPDILYQQRYQPIIDLFSTNMQSSGALRIDHVMALLRLWWVTKGDKPSEGGYVYYPVDDLLGILALESHRNQSLVIGEDLGTVPDEIRDKLEENGVHSYRVFFFEQSEDGGFFSPSHYPVQSMATLTTHDMPTLTGYWHCLDLELGKELNLYPSEEVLAQLYTSRHDNKQQILDSLHGHQSIPEWTPHSVDQLGMHKELNHGMQYHMAKGSSALLSLQLEDWLEMDKPVNIPGTCNEYPNWKRKLTRNLEQIFTDPVLNSLALGLTETRNKVSEQ
ncbi:4-alpha-glucanotransferase [Paraneptunicella aestuarii]|uniref:4-alpha-glucanotransferase n=1 Tax=Paraneptunicella aestuarii TaxID=2831148 RepID=UPI001E4E4580|nr:4-alpha-glucanotransferase [Paraneptunicella aestuarii]UAA40426.1 4-alpha-glucanotransferase [Paraneptunicella aestuarii]